LPPCAIEAAASNPSHCSGELTFWSQRRGQLDLACSQCHDDLAGRHLHGGVISQVSRAAFRPAGLARRPRTSSLTDRF
jgi:hypothetical protein